ncbi:MAG TPA: DUF3429 domain-containing protein [Caulobacteraceae bacterium]|jgi:hypothetical protein
MPAPVRVTWAVWALSLGGLIPFAAAAAVLLLIPGSPLAGPALLTLFAWSATVLSFLGGARWGMELAKPSPRPNVLAAACLPALAAWLIVAATPVSLLSWQPALLASAFIAAFLWDARSGMGRAYRHVRLVCTAGAVLALLVGLKATLG